MNRIKSKTALLRKSSKLYALGVAIILIIAFVHFAGQMFFIQTESLRSIETAAENVPSIDQIAEAKPLTTERAMEIEPEKYEAKNFRVVKMPESVKPKIRQPKDIVPARISEKKKIARETKTETRAERLRRAERLLTGI